LLQAYLDVVFGASPATNERPQRTRRAATRAAVS
jgi:hypothetical protein